MSLFLAFVSADGWASLLLAFRFGRQGSRGMVDGDEEIVVGDDGYFYV